LPAPEPLNVVGIDDWAFRRNHSYGTIVCDLERRRIVTLLPDREMATVEAWLAGRPDITVLSRDRGGGYGEAASKALPGAIQVADRWHLMENASSAFLSAVRKSMRPIRAAIGATTINPELLTCAERLQYEGYLRREETIATILALAKDGTAIKQIVRKTGHSRNRVRQVLRGDRGDVFRTRQSSLDAHLPLLDALWAGGCRNGAKLWRRLKLDGFRGSQRVVSEWATRRRRSEKASDQQLQKVPSARTIVPRLDQGSMDGGDVFSDPEAKEPIRLSLAATIQGTRSTSFLFRIITARPKARSPSSNSSSDRCTAEQRSISFRQD
jgi:transposase